MKQHQFARFDLTEAENIRIRIPKDLKRKVKDYFEKYIKYQSGITLKDAYLHCAANAIKFYKESRPAFSQLIEISMLEEEQSSKESLILMPLDISNDISLLKDGLGVKNKRLALLCAISIGLILFKKETEG